MIDTQKVLQTAKDMFLKQKENQNQVEEENEQFSEESGSGTDSADEMSFTSEENNQDNFELFKLIAGKKAV